MGSLTAGEDRFMPWRTRDGETIEPRGWPELDTLLAGAFERENLLDYLKGFVVFESDGVRLIKKIAGYHQFHAVRKAVRETVEASAADGDRKIGVVWHTQGSGKSLSMVFYAGQVIANPAMENPTLLLITDRTDLDDQLFGTFSGCKDLLRQTPVKAESRAELRELLSVVSGGVIFTTIQKFSPDEGDAHPLLTDRRNVVVIADEAHRTQYGFEAKLHREKGTLAYGFAKYLRDAIAVLAPLSYADGPARLEILGLGRAAIDCAFGAVIEQRFAPGSPLIARWLGALPRIAQRLDTLYRDRTPSPDCDLGDLTVTVAVEYIQFRLPEIDWRHGAEHLAKRVSVYSERSSLVRTRPE